MSRSDEFSDGQHDERERIEGDFRARRLLELFKELPDERKEALMTRLKKEAYNPDEVAEILGKSVEMVRRYLREGHIKGSKLGRTWIIPKAEIDRILKGEK
jgi:excisionase family DNA binding protein